MARRTKPLSRATDATAPTTGTAFAIPDTANVTQVEILLSADGYIGMGDDASPPTAADTNTTYAFANTLVTLYLDGVRQRDGAFVYVYAASGTLVAKLSYYA